MSSVRLKHRLPANEGDFERLCLALLKQHWNRPLLELYARRGEKQFGVDIIDLGDAELLHAGQCKLHESWKALTPAEIEAEVRKAREFRPPLGLYAILTTAKASRAAHDTVLQINRKHQKLGLFQVELMTWEKIERLLDEYTEVRDQVYATLNGRMAAELSAKLSGIQQDVHSISVEVAHDSFDVQIDEAKNYLERFEYQIARLLLDRLRQRHWDRLSSRQRFRVLSNLASAHLGERKYPEAAKLFLEAKEFQPEDERALCNEARAYGLLGETERAFKVAIEVCKRFPLSASAFAIWITAAPASFATEALKRDVPAALADDAEVCTALAERALRERSFDLAYRSAQTATSRNSERAYAWLLLGQAALNSEIFKYAGDFEALSLASSKERLRESIQFFSKAIDLSQAQRQSELEATALLDRGHAYEILQEFQLSDNDVERAINLMPNSVVALREHGRILLRRRQLENAIEVLKRAHSLERREDVQFLLAVALRETGQRSCASEAVDLLADIGRRPGPQAPGFREQAIEFALREFASDERWQPACLMLDEIPPGSVSETAMSSFQARLELQKGHREAASHLADAALASIKVETSKVGIRIVATLLGNMGRHAEALPLWERLAPLNYAGQDTRRLLDCASRLDRHEIILKVCKALREAGVDDPDLVQGEISILEKYDPEEAVRILQRYLDAHPDDRQMRLLLSYLGLRLEKDELIASDPSLLPAAKEVPPQNWQLMVAVMQRGGYVQEALSFAYKLLRNNFSNPAAHKAYLACLSPLALTRPNIPAPESVSTGTAVCYEEEGTNQQQWIVIEDESEPDRKLHEIAQGEALAKELNGKGVGDTFALSQDRRALIKSILSKYVYRYQECLTTWELNFPEIPMVNLIRVFKNPASPGPEQFDLSGIFKRLDQLEERSKVIEEIYAVQPLPLHVFGNAFGKDAFRAVYMLAAKPHLHINCCVGSVEECTEALESFRNAGELVLELTAIATLSLLKAEDLLTRLTAAPIISQGTMFALGGLVREEASNDSEEGYLGKYEGRYALVKRSDEDRLKAKERLSQLVGMLRQSCRVLPAQSLASVRPEPRKVLIEAFGQYGAESIALASNPGRVLWSDDRLLRGTARGEFGVRSVWTQVALEAVVSAGMCDADVYFEASAKLLGWGYYFTRVNLQTLIKAGSLADWNPAHWPLGQALNSFALETVELPDLVKLASGLMRCVYTEVPLPERRQAIVVVLLERLGGRRDGLSGLVALKKVLPIAFGLNAIGAGEAMNVIEAWLASRQYGGCSF